MALTIDSKIGDLLGNEKTRAILDKHIPGFSSHPQTKMANGMTLKVVAPMSQGKITPAVIKAIEKDLSKL